MKLNMKMEGVAELNATLKEMTQIEKALGRACSLVEREAKKNAPKDSGELRRSITSEVHGNEGVVFTPLFYAPYVEHGTGLFADSGGRKDVPWHYKDDKGEWHSTNGQHPQPFLSPALDNNREEVVRIIGSALLK